mgnify:CR=1 FL=1
MERTCNDSLPAHFAVRRAVVHGLGTCRGCCDNGTGRVGKVGGPRTNKTKIRFIHPDAQACLDEKFEISKACWSGMI